MYYTKLPSVTKAVIYYEPKTDAYNYKRLYINTHLEFYGARVIYLPYILQKPGWDKKYYPIIK